MDTSPKSQMPPSERAGEAFKILSSHKQITYETPFSGNFKPHLGGNRGKFGKKPRDRENDSGQEKAWAPASCCAKAWQHSPRAVCSDQVLGATAVCCPPTLSTRTARAALAP